MITQNQSIETNQNKQALRKGLSDSPFFLKNKLLNLRLRRCGHFF